MADLQDKIRKLPSRAGVYLFKDARGEVLYIGKATNLRSRIRAYFSATGDGRFLMPFLMPKIRDLDVLITENAKEALILENSLIKQHRPKYNVHLKDDKTYISLKLNPKHDFPRLHPTRAGVVSSEPGLGGITGR